MIKFKKFIRVLMKEYEMFCVSIDETNDLVEKMNVFFKKAKDFAKEFVIKKYAKNQAQKRLRAYIQQVV